MNAFRFAGDMSHLFSVLLLLLKIYATKSCSGISLKTQELYALVFLTRYLDLFSYIVSTYNTLMKIVFISSSVAIVWCMRRHPMVRRTYDRDQDTFRHYILIAASFALALFFHDKFTIREVFWSFSIFLESVAILPQLVLLQRSGNVDNLTSQYVLFLGISINSIDLLVLELETAGVVFGLSLASVLRAYRAFYILNWIYRFATEEHYSAWMTWIAGAVQTALYADFFYYYFLSWKNNAKLQLPA